MRITNSVYSQIKGTLGTLPAECGGILGAKGGIITHFYFDHQGTSDSYTPDIVQLEHIIAHWSDIGISFSGFIHSHPSHNTTLSHIDKKYISSIFLINHIKYSLYFPIVLSQADNASFDIVCYRAEMMNTKLIISKENLSLLM